MKRLDLIWVIINKELVIVSDAYVERATAEYWCKFWNETSSGSGFEVKALNVIHEGSRVETIDSLKNLDL